MKRKCEILAQPLIITVVIALLSINKPLLRSCANKQHLQNTMDTKRKRSSFSADYRVIIYNIITSIRWKLRILIDRCSEAVLYCFQRIDARSHRRGIRQTV